VSGYLEQVHAQAVRMQRLVEDLLTLAQLEGTQPAPARWVEVAELLETVATQARSVAPDGLTVEVALPPEPCAILGVRTELESALGNLALNAVRYTPAPGRVVIGARSVKNAEGELFVRDTGIGIAPEHLPRLTERFYRVDRARSRDRGGTGLGLAIVNHVAQRHGARLLIESTLGQGSEFRLRFPSARWRWSEANRSEDDGIDPEE
jgi:two-component system phosphate regulon sensor histidine kinase PhoR